MSQQSPWSSSSSQQPSRRRALAPISTASSSTVSTSAASSAACCSLSPPVNPSSTLSSSTSRFITRTPSVSSTPSPRSPSQQQHTQGQLPSAGRSKAIAHQSSLCFAASTAALSSASQGGGGAPGTGGGGSSKLARASPSFSHLANFGSSCCTSTASVTSSQSLAKIVIAQVFLLLSSLKEDRDRAKWEQQTHQIRKLVGSNGMEVFSKYFRRLLQSNAPHIFPASAKGGDISGSYGLLVEEMRKITRHSDQAYKISESIDTTEGDLFRDFDLSTFMDHFKLDPVAKTTLALACKTATKPDLKTKAEAILSNNYHNFLLTLFNSDSDSEQESVPISILAIVIDRLAQEPPRTWTDEHRESLAYTVYAKYDTSTSSLPPDLTAAMYMFELVKPENHLVKHVQRAGPRATSTLDSCKDLLASVETHNINFHQVANALLFMAITHNGQLYHPTNFVYALRERDAGQRLNWQDVVRSFDRKDLKLTSRQFLALYNALLPIARADEAFDVQLLWGGHWTHPETQLAFAVAFLACPPDELDVAQIPRLRRAFTQSQFDDGSPAVRQRASEVVKHPLVSLDATETLFNIVFRSNESYEMAQRSQIPQTIINQNTDIFVVAASAVPKPWIEGQEQAMIQLFAPLVEKCVPNVYSFALHGLWKQDSIWVTARFLDLYNANRLSLTTINEHAAEHGWIQTLVALNSDMSLDLAAIAHRDGIFDLDTWAQETLSQIHVFPKILASFLSNKAETDLQAQREPKLLSNVPLAVKTVHPLLGFLQGHLPDEELVSLQRVCIGAYPRLINYGQGFDEIIDANGNGKTGNAISPQADAKMQEHYKNMYSGESDVRRIIEELQRYKISEDPADQDLFSCMIHGLFDEYNCFGEYPIEALATTAVLFGGIIQYNLLSRIPLQAGLSMVLEAVQEYPPEASMYKFGLQALLNFSNRLHEWPSFCDRLLRVAGLRGTEVWNRADEIVRRQGPGETAGESIDDGQNDFPHAKGSVEDFGRELRPVREFNCLQSVPALRPDLHEDPDEEVQDKVLFVLNNVSERNLAEKLSDLKVVLHEQHYQWFASYLVEDRAKVQPNFQQLYLDMLALFDDCMLWAEVVRETYLSVIRMLNADSTMTSSTDRTHLKNLGAWLGSLTIARDKPILHSDISFKDLLIEGHDTQRLLTVIPFTCKVLSQASNSIVFKPPNPWVMEIIRLLMELYHFAELKLNLKFEIEVMCKGLDLDYKLVQPSDCIRSRPLREEELLAHALSNGIEGFHDLSLVGLNRPRAVNDRFSAAAIQDALPDLASALVYPPASSNMATTSRLRQIFHTAAQSAIAEIIAPVVERSVTIAAISSSQLVAKDFATEPDESKMREAAHTMVKSLSGSLALVTCKEPLRMSIMNNIRILARDLPEQTLPEGLILMFVNDNLDAVCGMVEQAAEHQSIAEIDLQVEGGVRARRYHRNTNAREPFNDPPVKHWATFIPEPYRQNSGGLNAKQLAIYDDFGRQTRCVSQINSAALDSSGHQASEVSQEHYPQVPTLSTPAEPPAMPRSASQAVSRLQGAPPMLPHPPMNGYLDAHTASERAMSLLLDLQRSLKETHEEHIEDLGPSAPARDVFEQLLHLVENSGSTRDALCVGIAGRVVGHVFVDAEHRLETEVMVHLIIQLCQISASTSRQTMMYLASMENDHLLNVPVVACMVAAGLLDLQRVDLAASKAIHARNPRALDFLSHFLDEALLSGSPAAFRADLAASLEALTEWLAEEPELEIGRLVMSKLKLPSALDSTTHSADARYQIEYMFEEWIHLVRFGRQPGPSVQAVVTFIDQLRACGFLESQNDSARFIRVCVECSVESYEREEAVPYPSLDIAYICVDGLAKLVVALTAHQGDADVATTSPNSLSFESILSLVIMVLIHHHRTRQNRFNQKVFFRLFCSVICELHDMRGDAMPELEPEFMLVMAKALLVLQPKYLPGFSFAWLALVSHRIFMSAMLRLADDGRWNLYAQLLELVLSYAGDLIKPAEAGPEAGPEARAFYRGVLRVLLVIHHDFPEFLAENHFRLCNAIPMHCTQLRNLVVSAYPSSYPELPDPFAAGFKVDRLDDVRKPPMIRCDIELYLHEHGIKDPLDKLLASTEQTAEDIQKLCDTINQPMRDATGPHSTSVPVDTSAMHAVAIYVGSDAVSAAGKGPIFSSASAHARLVEKLTKALAPEGRYHFLSAMTNQLRWPNSHTHWFSYAILHLFGSNGNQVGMDVKQQITRVLLERLLVHRPHPWGLITTLLEILKNRDYQFWDLPFVQAAPEVERLFGALFQHINQSPRAIS